MFVYETGVKAINKARFTGETLFVFTAMLWVPTGTAAQDRSGKIHRTGIGTQPDT